MKFLYLVTTYAYVLLLSPFVWLRRLLGDRQPSERLGFNLPPGHSSKQCYWFVASSVGEVNLAAKLIAGIRKRSDVNMLITVTTAAGRQQALRSCGNLASVCYHPFDVGPAVARFLRRFRPAKLVLIETELWPVLLERAIERGVVIMQAAGRISAKSFLHYRAFRSLFAPLLQCFAQLLMQSETDAVRIIGVGGRSEATEVLGSPKSDYAPPPEAALAAAAQLLKEWKQCPTITCGSTRPGEEAALLEAYNRLRSSIPNLKLILAPRHLKRSAEVSGIIRQSGAGFTTIQGQPPTADTNVLLVDTIGELNALYHHSDVAFVGGTLAPLGGHNLLEPALAGCPVIYGPHFYNQQPAAELLEKYGLGFLIRSAGEFSELVAELVTGGSPRDRFAAQVEQLRNANAYIVDNYVDRILR